ncbi:hypothetical protein ACFLRG_01305 [Bacteroidota bacterium]
MKTIIKKLSTLLVVVLLYLSSFENCNAQDYSKTAWNKIILLHFEHPLVTNDWEYSHPSYSGAGGLQILRETGSFKSKSIFSGQFELSKGYFGFSASVGIFPAEIKVDKNEDPFNLNSFFIEIEGLFFPLKNPTSKLVPIINIGAGGVISVGDIDNTAQFVSFGGGLRTFFTKSFGVSLMLKGRYFNYNEIPLTESITGDIKFTNFAAHVGVMYAF